MHVGAAALATRGRGCAEILLNGVACSGSELRLLDCPVDTGREEECSHFDNARVWCATSGEICIRAWQPTLATSCRASSIHTA
jgi:hypothetical protein